MMLMIDGYFHSCYCWVLQECLMKTGHKLGTVNAFTFPFGSTNCIRFKGYNLSPVRTPLKYAANLGKRIWQLQIKVKSKLNMGVRPFALPDYFKFATVFLPQIHNVLNFSIETLPKIKISVIYL